MAKVKDQLAFWIYAAPISINSMYQNKSGKWKNGRRGRGRRLTDRARSLKNEIGIEAGLAGPIRSAPAYALAILFYLPMFTQAGKMRSWDISNHVKLIEDATFSALGKDDKHNVFLKVAKFNNKEGEYRFGVHVKALNSPTDFQVF